MRDFKFKAWDGVDFYPFTFDNIDAGSIMVLDTSPKSNASWASLKELEIFQYTGLLDSNGIEICEGDILEIKLPAGGFWGVDYNKTGTVIYDKDRGSFIVQWEWSKNQHHVILNLDIAYGSKILGNIKIK